MNATPDDLRETLRRRTAGAHRRLDSAPAQRNLVRPGLSLRAYAATLDAHARAHAVCEAALERASWAAPADLPTYRPRLPALRADLAHLPRVGPSPRVEPPAVREVPTSEAHALGRVLGLRYVLDGATQGARFIAPRLARTLPELRDGGFAYWRVLADAAGDWLPLTRALAARDARGPVAEEALRAADAAFDAFLNVLTVDGTAEGGASKLGPGSSPTVERAPQ